MQNYEHHFEEKKRNGENRHHVPCRRARAWWRGSSAGLPPRCSSLHHSKQKKAIGKGEQSEAVIDSIVREMGARESHTRGSRRRTRQCGRSPCRPVTGERIPRLRPG